MQKIEKHIKVGDPKFIMLSRNYDPTDPDHTIGDVDHFECMLEDMLDEAKANENETEINAIQNELQLLSQLTLQGVERIILS